MKVRLGAAVVGVLAAGLTLANAAAAQLACRSWNTEAFFTAATVADVSRCLEAGANIDARSEDGLTPLHFAAGFGDSPAALKALLAAGANIEARDENGWTPLHAAAYNSAGVVKALLTAGANPKALTFRASTPADLIQENDALKGTDAYWLLLDRGF